MCILLQYELAARTDVSGKRCKNMDPHEAQIPSHGGEQTRLDTRGRETYVISMYEYEAYVARLIASSKTQQDLRIASSNVIDLFTCRSSCVVLPSHNSQKLHKQAITA